VWLGEVVGLVEQGQIGGYIYVGAVGGEIPHGVVYVGGGIAWVGVAPDQLLHWVIVGQADQCSLGG